MRAGKLRHPITIQRPVEARDDFGSVTPTWEIFATTRAEILGLSGREFFAAQQVNSEITTKIKIRHRAGILPTMRVLHGSTVYQLAAPALDPTGRGEELHLLCTLVNEEAP